LKPGEIESSRGELTASQSILEDLLETQELKDGQVDSWVETETALVWTEGRVELDSVTTVDLWLSLVVLPDNAELNDALWDRGNGERLSVLWVLLEERGVLEGGCELCRTAQVSSIAFWVDPWVISRSTANLKRDGGVIGAKV
jgi:hypothetical protein